MLHFKLFSILATNDRIVRKPLEANQKMKDIWLEHLEQTFEQE